MGSNDESHIIAFQSSAEHDRRLFVQVWKIKRGFLSTDIIMGQCFCPWDHQNHETFLSGRFFVCIPSVLPAKLSLTLITILDLIIEINEMSDPM